MALFHIFYFFIDIFILFIHCFLISLSIFETVVLKSLSNTSNAQASSEMISVNLFCSIEYYSVILWKSDLPPSLGLNGFCFAIFWRLSESICLVTSPNYFCRLYQLLCVVNEISVPLAFAQVVFWLRFFSTSMILKPWTKKNLSPSLQIYSVLGHFNT